MIYTPIPVPQPYFDPFPLDALGPMLSQAVIAQHWKSKVAVEAIASNALAVAAAAVQDHVNVQRPNCKPSPVSLFMGVIAGTSEGKDTAAAPFIHPVIQAQAELDQRQEQDACTYAAQMVGHNAHRYALKAAMREAARNGDDLGELLGKYASLESKIPCKPHRPKIIHNDITSGGLVRSMAAGDSNILLHTTEGSGFLNGPMGRQGPLLNSLWDASSITRERALEEQQEASDYRFSLLLAIQPPLFQKYLNRYGDEAKGSGLFGRMLFVQPPTTLGYRMLDSTHPSNLNSLDAVSTRIFELLVSAAQRRVNGQDRVVHEFSDPAKLMFVNLYNEFQLSLRAFGEFSTVPSQAGKGAEQVARVAAILHAFDGTDGPIDISTLDRATRIVLWYLRQAVTIFRPAQEIDHREHDASMLLASAWKLANQGIEMFTGRDLRQFCDLQIPSKRADAAVNLMIDRGQLWLVSHRSTKKLALPRPKYPALR